MSLSFHAFCPTCGYVHHITACEGLVDAEWESLLESPAALDESVGDLDNEAMDLLILDCEAGGRSLWQVEEDERARKAAEAAWAARARELARKAAA